MSKTAGLSAAAWGNCRVPRPLPRNDALAPYRNAYGGLSLPPISAPLVRSDSAPPDGAPKTARTAESPARSQFSGRPPISVGCGQLPPDTPDRWGQNWPAQTVAVSKLTSALVRAVGPLAGAAGSLGPHRSVARLRIPQPVAAGSRAECRRTPGLAGLRRLAVIATSAAGRAGVAARCDTDSLTGQCAVTPSQADTAHLRAQDPLVWVYDQTDRTRTLVDHALGTRAASVGAS